MAAAALSATQELGALKIEAGRLARLHRQARDRAAGRLPELGSLLETEEDFVSELGILRAMSPLLLVDGAPGSGKSSFINALLLGEKDGEMSRSSEEDVPLLLRVGTPCNTSSGRPLIIVRPSHDSERRFLEGRPSLEAGGEAEARMRVLSRDEWLSRCGGVASMSSEPGLPQQEERPNLAQPACPLPLVFEDVLAVDVCPGGLWLAEVDVEDCRAEHPRWVSECADVVCVACLTASAGITSGDEQRVRRHMDAGRRVLLVVTCGSIGDGDAGPSSVDPAVVPAETCIAALFADRQESEDHTNFFVGVHVVSLVPATGDSDAWVEVGSAEAALDIDAVEQVGQWPASWSRCRDAFRKFAASAGESRLAGAREHTLLARESFVRWCAQGTKVLAAVLSRFQQDAEDVRMARDLITRNIDAAYLAHYFCSVLVGKFDTMCVALRNEEQPDLGGSWGRQATRRKMEQRLSELLEGQLREAMHASLLEVTNEMAKQEKPALEQICRVARRGTTLPWKAEVRALEVELRPENLQHFAMLFFGSMSVGVLTGLGAAAIEVLIGELALGPVGVVVGVATFAFLGMQDADWPSVREQFVRKIQARQLELIAKARDQLDFPGLCERRKRRIVEQMDVILAQLLGEVSALSEVSSEFAQCAVALESQRGRTASFC